jgi:hypothetical protein
MRYVIKSYNINTLKVAHVLCNVCPFHDALHDWIFPKSSAFDFGTDGMHMLTQRCVFCCMNMPKVECIRLWASSTLVCCSCEIGCIFFRSMPLYHVVVIYFFFLSYFHSFTFVRHANAHSRVRVMVHVKRSASRVLSTLGCLSSDSISYCSYVWL